MIGPGTGVAPFRSIIQDELVKPTPRKIYLIFGSRNRSKDFYFETEWQALAQKHSQNFQLFTAFSRDQEDKFYVQHVIQKHKNIFGPLILEEDAFVYIAGNSKQMPDQVKDALTEAVKHAADDNDEEDEQGLKAFVNDMISQKRLQMETWS